MDKVINGVTYSFAKLPARSQFHIARRLAPFMTALTENGNSINWGALPNVLADMSDDNADYIVFGLLECVSRKMDGGAGYAPVSSGHNIMYSDITLDVMIKLVIESLKHNLGNFTNALHSDAMGGHAK